MNLGLDGRTALIAGASRGIGLSIARALSDEGCAVALVARGVAALEHAAATFSDRRSSIHVADLRKPDEAGRAAAAVVERWSSLDVLVCNVGSGASVPPGQETSDEWQRVFDVNFFAAANTIAAARPYMAAAPHDRSIVCISSICGIAALGAPVTYSAAKSAVHAMVRGLARPLADEGIRINAIAPGNILFEGGTWAQKATADPAGVDAMLNREVALRRFGRMDEIADAVTFLSSPRSSFVTGTVMIIDGGQLRA